MFHHIIVNVIGIVLSVVAFGMVDFAAQAALFERSSEDARTSLIELYTSEGCSSCPPAEAWLGRLKSDPGLWKDFVPVAFHVDYWDNLGWTDRFARKDFTARQHDYANAWGARSVYTPGFVRDGHEWADWRNSSMPARSSARHGVLHVKETEPGNFTATFAPADGRTGDLWFSIAALGFDASSQVNAGENSGRKLMHDFVALIFEEKKTATNEVTFHLSRPEGIQVSRLALAVWVSRSGEMEPIQSVGGWWDR
ncbi:MAG: hypothetical protein JWR26_1848 [Pedosphaera sp.]|nr:hypothetical protein [Pedosphaera sp.]